MTGHDDQHDDRPPDVELSPGTRLRRLRPGLWTVEGEHDHSAPTLRVVEVEAGQLAELLATGRAPLGVPLVITTTGDAAPGIDAGNVPGTREQEGTG
jgi:hypothetical protein